MNTTYAPKSDELTEWFVFILESFLTPSVLREARTVSLEGKKKTEAAQKKEVVQKKEIEDKPEAAGRMRPRSLQKLEDELLNSEDEDQEDASTSGQRVEMKDYITYANRIEPKLNP